MASEPTRVEQAATMGSPARDELVARALHELRELRQDKNYQALAQSIVERNQGVLDRLAGQ
jgi:hypothetical protein